MKKIVLAVTAALAMAGATAYADDDGYRDDDRYSNKITIIQTGDFHGHLAPRQNLRSNSDGRMVGGLARIATVIKKARYNNPYGTLVMHTGDTIQGSGEALYTRGKAIVDVVDMLGINAYAPGNWDYVYGPDRFKEFFVNSDGTAKRWGAVVSNLYYDATNDGVGAPLNPTSINSEQATNYSSAEYATFADWYLNNGKRLLKPYQVKTVKGVKIGILGCTTSRGPQVVGSWVTKGLIYTDCAREIPKFAEQLRTQEGAKFVVLVSEIEIGRNIEIMKTLANANQHVDLVLNADMHEETLVPIKVANTNTGLETLIVEAGQDGTLVNEISLTVSNGAVTAINHTPRRIDDSIRENEDVAEKVAKVSYKYNRGFDATIPCTSSSPYWNSFTEATCLNGPLNAVVGKTEVALHRNNYSHENMPAVIEGSSHDFVADAIRWWAKSDMATVRGFRYGTQVQGDITRGDLFHYVPIGPRIGKASRVVPNQIRNQVDNSSLAVFSGTPNADNTPVPRYNNTYGQPTITNADGTVSPNPKYGTSPGAGLTPIGTAGNSLGWGGGWLFAYSADGFHMDFAPYFKPNWQTVKTGAPGSAGAGVYLDVDLATGKSYNIQVTAAATDTSRARSMTMEMSCDRLPPGDKARDTVGSNGEAKDASGNYPVGTVVITLNNNVTCNASDVGYTGRGKTVLTKAKDGVWMPSWAAPYTKKDANGNTVNDPKNVYMLVLDNAGADAEAGWQYLQGLANQPNQANAAARPFQFPTLTVAGYWYKQSPNTINNCNNCLATGTSNVVGDPEAAYLLPVNQDANGNAALDANNNPIYVRDEAGNVVFETDANGKRKPKVEGSPIDLTQVVEKYLASLGTVTAANLPINRIGLVNDGGTAAISLPDFSTTMGFPVQQPLCGTIGKDAAQTVACPQ